MDKRKKTINKIAIFEGNEIRRDILNNEWVYSVIDIIAILTESSNPRKYWSVLKTRLKQEGSELATNCSQLKMQSADRQLTFLWR